MFSRRSNSAGILKECHVSRPAFIWVDQAAPCFQAGEIAAYLVAIIRHISARLPVAQALLLLLPVLPRTMASAQTAHLSSVQSILSLPSALNYPQEMAIDGSGNIYIADAYNKRVLKLTPSASGGFTQSTIGTGWNIPYGLAVDAGGNVYVADIFFTTLIKETPMAAAATRRAHRERTV